MFSLREIYRIGHGPSSSHSMGPALAARELSGRYPEADSFRVTLQGSLAKTGKGHRTDYAIRESLKPYPAEIVFDPESTPLPHPNTLLFEAFREGCLLGAHRVMSVGGGAFVIEGEERPAAAHVYPLSDFSSIRSVCELMGCRLPDYVKACEGEAILSYLAEVWTQMKATLVHGLSTEGHLPGGLQVRRRASLLYEAAQQAKDGASRERFLLSAYAYATAEENAAGELMVTAPTCGASGVLPAVLFFEQTQHGVSDEDIVRALAAAGLIGNIIKTNGSISGAECGCQAEIGSACTMAAAALSELGGQSLAQLCCAAEIAMEHNLGLTCDPVAGLVQIPCIERNAMAALRAYDSAALAEHIYPEQKIPLDLVIRTMKETGRDLSSHYRETAEGGLAKLYVKDFD